MLTHRRIAAEPTPVTLGFGDAIDKCVLKHYPKLSSPCQQAIMQVPARPVSPHRAARASRVVTRVATRRFAQ